MRRLFPLIILLSFSLIAGAQVNADLLRMARQTPGGTARSVALGGAFGALGGDYGSALQNPAGLGVYRSSELSFTPEIYYNTTDADYAGINTQDWIYNSRFSQFSYVAAFNLKGRNLVGGSFAIGFNNLNDYSSNLRIEGDNVNTSFVDEQVQLANYGSDGNLVAPWNLDPYSTKLFFDGYIIDWDENSYFLNTDMVDASGNVNLNQVNTIQRTGKLNEWSAALALNFNHRLYFGASVSLLPVYFEQISEFAESDPGASGTRYYDFNQWEYVDGNGVNGKFGAIFKPLRMLRVGLSWQTPTVFFLTRTRDATLDSYLEGTIYPIDEEGYDLYEDIEDYRIKTPGKIVGSLGIMLGKSLLVSSDLEVTDYSGMELRERSDSRDFDPGDFGYAINLKNGVEFRLKQFYLRGGFAYYGSPYKSSLKYMSAPEYVYSGGIGIRGKRYFFDVAMSWSDLEYGELLYDSPYADGPTTAAIDSYSLRAIATLGFRFK